jgi:hypothetical protein
VQPSAFQNKDVAEFNALIDKSKLKKNRGPGLLDRFDTEPTASADLLEWLEPLTDDERARQGEAALRAGHVILTMIQATSGEEQMRTFFRPVTEKMDDLKGILEGIIRSAQKSQKLGELGEEIVVKQLQGAFPTDAFTVHSSEGHQADIEAELLVLPELTQKALVEVKLYSGDVPKKEINKLLADLKSQNVKYGLMVSLSSRIAGMAQALTVEEKDGVTILYVSRAGLDGVNLISAMALLKAIMGYHAKSQERFSLRRESIEKVWHRLERERDELVSISRLAEGFKEQVRDIQSGLNDQFHALSDSAAAMDLRLKVAVERIMGKMRDELMDLPTENGPSLLPASSVDDVAAALVALDKAGDKRAPVIRRLVEIGHEVGAEVRVEGNAISFLKHGKTRAEISGTKNRVDLVVHLIEGDEVRFKPGLEDYKKKDDSVLVQGHDLDLLYRRARVHLGGG